MDYDVTHDAALAVVKSAADEVAGYETDLTALAKALAQAEGALGHSEAVVEALGEYMASEATVQIEGILGHSASAVTHTSEAIAYYVEGSAEMAATAARASATTHLPSEMPGQAGGLRKEP